MKKKTILMTLMLLCAVAQGAWAQEEEEVIELEVIPYIFRSWDSVNKKVVEEERAIEHEWTDLSTIGSDWGTDGAETWVVVKENMTRGDRATVHGTVHLVLTDGKTLKMQNGITVNHGATLHIYAQSSGDNMGKLESWIVLDRYNNDAAIGGSGNNFCGDIVIQGGDVKAWGYDGAAIGGSEDHDGGNITIYGGKVTAKGGMQFNSDGSLDSDKGNAAGIGGGYAGSGGNIIIYDGEVTATGGKNAAGIGGGETYNGGGAAGSITIWGGTVTATGGDRGTGIGAGKDCADNNGSITIYGGTVRAQGGGSYSFGLGGGNGCPVNLNGGEIYLSGGTIGQAIGASSLTFDKTKVFRGTGADTYAALHTPVPLRVRVCGTNRYAKIVSCTDHQFICSVCSRCGLHSDSEMTSTYTERTWDGTKVVETECDIVDAINLAEPLTEIPPTYGTEGDYDIGGDISGRTYYVSGELDLNDYTLYVDSKESRIILCDDGELKVHHILLTGLKSTLHIFGQKEDKGKMTVNEAKTSNGRYVDQYEPKDLGYVAIGGVRKANDCNIHFHGGDVMAYSINRGGSTIGFEGDKERNYLHFYGGKVEAQGFGDYCGGIGDGTTVINIYGGTVIGRGDENGIGIGGSWMPILGYTHAISTQLYIYNGIVKGYGGNNAVGIGGQSYLTGIGIRIRGGEITAVGGDNAAGIGGGERCAIQTLEITGGTVTATGGKNAAGIGGGYGSRQSRIHIENATIHAYGGENGSGIGAGAYGRSGNIVIASGTVYAESTGADSKGSGIGAGYNGSSYNITILGGTIYSQGGAAGGAAIGSDVDWGKGYLNLPDNYKVNAGNSANDIERRFTAFERKGACWYRKYAEIAECDHLMPTRGSDFTPSISYTVGEDNTHTRHCRYCNDRQIRQHEFDKYGQCSKCGKVFNSDEDTWTITIYQANTSNSQLAYDGDYDGGTEYKVMRGNSFDIPDLTNTTDGLTMMAMVKDPASAPSHIWLTDSEISSQANFFDPSQQFTPTQDTKFYARYRLDFTSRWEWGTKDNGRIDPDNVELWLSNPLLYGGNEQSIVADINVKENMSEDDITYTATVNYPYQYPDLSVGVTYSFSDVKHDRYRDDEIDLYDDQNNYWTISDYVGYITDIKLKGRTFYHDGSWNTLYLPFNLSAEQMANEECPLHGATIKKLEDAWFADGTLTLTFKDVSVIEAGMPYIVKWPQGDDVTDPVFKEVLPDNDFNYTFIIKDKDGNKPEEEEDVYFGLIFYGSINPVNITEDIVATRQILYLGAGNKLYYPNAPMTIGAFRAYFQLHKINAGDLEEIGVKAIRLDFGDDEATGIITTDFTDEHDSWLTIDGRQLSKQPAQPGIYIHNGQKVMLK